MTWHLSSLTKGFFPNLREIEEAGLGDEVDAFCQRMVTNLTSVADQLGVAQTSLAHGANHAAGSQIREAKQRLEKIIESFMGDDG
ncbi:MAG TPA: hypothetical protein VLF21_03355 [Candidatus Saccharimonadales bacterium]|nr:hypothetical protein [Candidatus Saccharimonadales bacterium]